MAKSDLFTAVWARCPEHGTLLEADQTMCDKCKLIQRNLSLVPPFQVYCKSPYWGHFEVGHIYEVFWVGKEILNQYGVKTSGYIFQNEDKSLWEHVADPLNFIPMQYLTKDNKDTWLLDE